MAVATSTLILGGILAAKTGMDVYNAKQQGKAVEKAAGQQTEAIKEARAYAEPLYNQTRDQMGQVYQQSTAGLAPYAQQGAQGMMALSDFLGVPRAPAATAAPMAAAPVAPAPGADGPESIQRCSRAWRRGGPPMRRPSGTPFHGEQRPRLRSRAMSSCARPPASSSRCRPSRRTTTWRAAPRGSEP